MSTSVADSDPSSVNEALRSGKQRSLVLVGQLDRNQGRPTFTGRMTLEQFSDLTVVHNRRWAEDAGESLDIVTQREIIDSHANGLATFMLQGLVSATIQRAKEDSFPDTATTSLETLQDRVGKSAHYGLPAVTLVLSGDPEVRVIKDDAGEVVAARLILPAGRFFVVADGQHRREAARRVRSFLNDTISNRRTPKGAKFYPAEDAPLSTEEVEAWVTVQETYRSWTMVAYEGHIGLSIEEAKQLFTNYNCHVKPVKADLNLEFDTTNPINRFAKGWLQEQLPEDQHGRPILDLRQLASINGLLFMGKTSIKSAPYNVDVMEAKAREFWSCVISSPDWKRPGSYLREVPVLKSLAKSWFQVFLAKRNAQLAKGPQLREYLRTTKFDGAWIDSVPGLNAYILKAEDGSIRFSPSHNDIVPKIMAHALK